MGERPGGEEMGDAHQRRAPSALDQALAAGNPLDHQLKKALKNYEVFYSMDRGSAKVENLRESECSIGTWAQFDLTELSGATDAGRASKPALLGKIYRSPTWRTELAGFLKCAIRSPSGYRNVAVCENATGMATYLPLGRRGRVDLGRAEA